MRRIKEIKDIPLLPYEGYLWCSDQKKPQLIDGDFHHGLLTTFPCVVEGMLYDKQSNTSIHIKHINGEYWITLFDLNAFVGRSWQSSIEEYLPNGTISENVEKIIFTELWEEQTIPEYFEDGFTTFLPKAFVFTGFKKA
jgi:CRISPR type III-associated protein (TIGR04423 family)